jgi:glycosyltransferase involved in cell wall biosynthesis
VRFSLVLATVGRTADLGRFLASLAAQTHRDFELVVVDQNDDDRLAPVLAPYEESLSILRLRSPERGASRGRNLGLGHVGGDLIAFPDDDCWYPPDLLERVDEFFVRHPDRDGLTGRSIDGEGRASNGRFGADPCELDRISVWGRGIEYAMFFRESSVRGMLFDERLGVGAGTAWGAGEATDYLLRLVDRGASLYYDPGVTVFHPSTVPPYDARAARKAYSYGCGMGRVLREHRMPLSMKARWLVRPLGGAVISLAGLDVPKARYRWNTFRGRARGLA